MGCQGDPSPPVERRLRPSPLPLQGLLASLRLWPWPLQMLRSGLKQVWVLPTAIAQLWEPLAVNSDSATSVTDLPSPQRSPDDGKRGDAAPPCPVLLVGVGGTGGAWQQCREPTGRRRPRPFPQVRTREGPSQLLSGMHPPVTSLAPLGCWKVSSFLPQL